MKEIMSRKFWKCRLERTSLYQEETRRQLLTFRLQFRQEDLRTYTGGCSEFQTSQRQTCTSLYRCPFQNHTGWNSLTRSNTSSSSPSELPPTLATPSSHLSLSKEASGHRYKGQHTGILPKEALPT